MIRLTLNPHTNPEIHLFNKSTVIIGSDPNSVDLVLNGKEIKPQHIKINEQQQSFILINEHNDPFVVINRLPFGKKLLNNNDTIEIHGTIISFENLNEPVKKEPEPLQADHKKLNSFLNLSLPFENEVEAFKEEEVENDHLELYIRDLETQVQAPLPHQLKKETKAKKTGSLKDDYLKDLDDDYPHKGKVFATDEASHPFQTWKWMLILIFSIFLISALVSTVIYFSVSDKTEDQETKAAQGIADLAIALTHARLNLLHSHNPNWSDAEFLKNNLHAILPNIPSYASQIDAHGHFNCCPYNLRIYTSSDLSRFLLIAQPEPTILNWLIPKSLIIVDSQAMELRTLKDVRSLNRLLANPDPLDGSSSKEISALVKQGNLIRLASLAHESGRLDYAPPKSLGFIKPGAENYIYNAPRYYLLGDNIIQKVTALATNKASSHEVGIIKQEVGNLSSLDNLIFYSPQGKQSALQFKEGLMMFAPSNNFLFGYLIFNQKGTIYQSHILKDSEEQHDDEHEYDQIAMQDSPEEINRPLEKQSNVDTNHPIYIQLKAMATTRLNELRPYVDAIVDLIHHELHSPSSSFQKDFHHLSHEYVMNNAKHKRKIEASLESLYVQYEEMPTNQFIAFVKELNLHQLIQEDEKGLRKADEKLQENIEQSLAMIEKSETLDELDNLIHIASTQLNFAHIKDSKDLIKYQNRLRNQVLIQLERHILSDNTASLTPAYKEILLQILNQERLIHPEEKSFFLQEYEERTKEKG
jgi:hypothetical protein